LIKQPAIIRRSGRTLHGRRKTVLIVPYLTSDRSSYGENHVVVAPPAAGSVLFPSPGAQPITPAAGRAPFAPPPAEPRSPLRRPCPVPPLLAMPCFSLSSISFYIGVRLLPSLARALPWIPLYLPITRPDRGVALPWCSSDISLPRMDRARFSVGKAGCPGDGRRSTSRDAGGGGSHHTG
jgi:hypothetical protein